MNKQSKTFAGFITLIIILLSGLIFTSCTGKDKTIEDASTGTPVKITHPVIMNFTDYISLNGNTIFLEKEIVRASFQGFIEKVYKNIGDRVNSGDNLFSIKTREYAATDSMNIKIGEKIFNGSVFIKSKSSGVLSDLNYHAGDFVTDGEQLAVISNPTSLRIKLNVPFEESRYINIGKKCKIDLPDGRELNGIIEKSVPSVDPATQTQTYLIKLEKRIELPENLNLLVKISVANFNNAVVVPRESIMSDVTESEFWLMKLINDSTAIKVDIKKGIVSDSLVQILTPELTSADRIIKEGAYGLSDTANIEITR